MSLHLEHHETAQADKVPVGKRAAWGLGGIADNFIMNAFMALAMPIYNIGMGLSPILVGWALFFPRLVDAITDPLMGNISDNTHTRWGRRRPYIVIGAIISAVLLPLLWLPPFSSETMNIIYIALMGSVYLVAYTVFVVPYTALGFELTNDYDERTRVLAWRMYLGLLAGMCVPWFYKLCLLENMWWGDNEVKGAVYVSLVVGVVILATGLAPALLGREKVAIKYQERIGFWDAIIFTFKNRPFRIMMSSYLVIITSMFTCGILGLYINIYYVCQGDKEFAATIGGYTGSMMAVLSYVSIFIATWVSVRLGKRHAMMLGLLIAIVGTLSLWVTLTPRNPYLQFVSFFILGLGFQGCWLMIDSMTADVCDEDELVTGRRREGLYSAVKGFAMKLSMSLAAVLQGALLTLSGFDVKVAELTGTVSDEVITRLMIMFIFLQAAVLVIALVIFYYYPITREKAEETRRLLDERHATAQAEQHTINQGESL